MGGKFGWIIIRQTRRQNLSQPVESKTKRAPTHVRFEMIITSRLDHHHRRRHFLFAEFRPTTRGITADIKRSKTRRGEIARVKVSKQHDDTPQNWGSPFFFVKWKNKIKPKVKKWVDLRHLQQQQLSIMDGAVHEKVHDKKFECPRALLLSLFFFFSFLSRGWTRSRSLRVLASRKESTS